MLRMSSWTGKQITVRMCDAVGRRAQLVEMHVVADGQELC